MTWSPKKLRRSSSIFKSSTKPIPGATREIQGNENTGEQKYRKERYRPREILAVYCTGDNSGEERYF
jgi:hypothetical protein